METEKRWLKLYPDQIAKNVYYRADTLPQLLKYAANEYPKHKAIHFMGKEMTFKTLYKKTLQFAAYLQHLGVKKGDRVAVMLPNIPQTVISFYAILQAGAIAVPVNPLYQEREIEFIMKDSGAKVIITLDMLYNRVERVMKQTDLEHIIVTSIKDYLPFPKNIVYPFIQAKEQGKPPTITSSNSTHLYTQTLKSKESVLKEVPINFEEDIAILQYTGGTTGFPKGVILTHQNLVANTSMCRQWLYKMEKGKEKMLAVMPLFHVYGLMTVLVLSVMEVYKMILVPKFDASGLLKTIHKQKPTVFPGAPTIYIGLMNHPDISQYDLSSIKGAISGSAPLPVEVIEKFEEKTGGKIVEGYGLTETSPVTHVNFLWDNEIVKGSIGVPWPGTDAAIFSLESGEILPVGEVGELAIKGPQVMKGYWNNDEETNKVLKDGWLLTGDIAYMDEKGYFYIVDRKKDIIIAGGFNIYPREIEEVLYEHPAVMEASVVGVKDPYRGETVKAFIVLREGMTVTEEELNQFMRRKLASFKVPRIYEFREELPKTAVGKVLRRQLKKESEEENE
ncbi:long-chain fatty acid--CoA ligase [Niallia circulans]|uniref:Long-chain fatty acid--CoA ligase n=1 Tax=Niallia circulans TaxID=1397 RepID=A0A0J1IKN0_NIACI|nr:long-chain-fatty-acid--CoA ligase [Niallia circulans]KLV26496.1 long-chain fatty acid--CoA ligase [Niallia circulans]MDR4317343.1 long-chain fatty acid--CoA ligase [Niallia circulans]MED3838835.1 long-chain-fatty-acid--CoA ligase [Niallia circulans]MED4245232.1 long-chain-fatty-acid--CoA ligase [Niallia circulans]MED4248620.1 long-chain-fatty-acid--CoA ligase [Niallia circulans]